MATFKARYFFYNFINALIPKFPAPESAIDALKIANVVGLTGLVLLSEDGRLFAGRVCDEVRRLLRLPANDDDEDEWVMDAGVPDVPPNSPVDLVPSTSNNPSGLNTPKSVGLPSPGE